MDRYIVCVDAGHGGQDPGASYDSYLEKTYALMISELLIDLLTSDGLAVVTTRINDYSLHLHQRVLISKRAQSDLFISIHINGFPDPTANGIETWYRTGSKQSKKAANRIHSKLIQEVNLRNRGTKPGNFHVLRESHPIPAVLCELGFITNAHDRRLITSREFQVQAAKCIANGVLAFIREVNLSN